MRCSMCMTKKNESLIRSIFDCVLSYHDLTLVFTLFFRLSLKKIVGMKTRKRKPYASKTINAATAKHKTVALRPVSDGHSCSFCCCCCSCCYCFCCCWSIFISFLVLFCNRFGNVKNEEFIFLEVFLGH